MSNEEIIAMEKKIWIRSTPADLYYSRGKTIIDIFLCAKYRLFWAPVSLWKTSFIVTSIFYGEKGQKIRLKPAEYFDLIIK